MKTHSCGLKNVLANCSKPQEGAMELCMRVFHSPGDILNDGGALHDKTCLHALPSGDSSRNIDLVQVSNLQLRLLKWLYPFIPARL